MGHRNRVCALPQQYTKIKIELDRTLVYKYYQTPYTLVHIIPESAKTEVLFKNFY